MPYACVYDILSLIYDYVGNIVMFDISCNKPITIKYGFSVELLVSLENMQHVMKIGKNMFSLFLGNWTGFLNMQ